MKKSLVSKIVAIILITAVIMLLSVLAALNIYNRQIAKDSITTTIRILENIILDKNMNTLEDCKRLASFKNMSSDIRVSILSKEGFWFADSFISDIDEMGLENQSDKQEIMLAKLSAAKIGYSIRHSDTHDYSFIYAAKLINISSDESIILRVSTPLSYANRYMVGFSITIIIIMTVLLLIPILLFLPRFITHILSPFEMMKRNLNSILENNFRYTKSITKYDEINSILEEINEVSHKLKANIEENKREKEKLNYVLENINQGLIAIDENAHIMFINSYALSLLNVSDFGSKFIIEVIRDSVIELEIEKAIKERKYIALEYSPTYIASKTILKIEVVPLYERLHSLIKISDITEIKKLEIEKNELFVNASHKLNTPLTSIIGYSDILLLNQDKLNQNKQNELNQNEARVQSVGRDNQEAKDTSSFIVRINEQAKKMKGLISDMLELTKYQKSSNLYDNSVKEIVDLKAEIENIVDEMSIVAKNKNVLISVDAQSGSIIFVNKKYIEDALENLLDNAIKYNKENGSVHISVKNIGKKIVFIISDKGIGIPEQYINRIFERFFRVSNKNTKNIEGTGIGLSIVRYVCMSCNASLSVRSIENIGTDITIEFPQASVPPH